MPDPTTIRRKLDESRRDLLDLSGRNRLINTPLTSSRLRHIHIVDERSEAVFRLLVTDAKAMTFKAGEEGARDEGSEEGARDQGAGVRDENAAPTLPTSEPLPSSPTPDPRPLTPDLAQPDADELTETGVPQKHIDTQLQTRLTSENLQKRLLKMFYDARTFVEEQGVNILYLAMGFVKWYETPQADQPRFAPLLLVPVSLERQSAGTRFRLRALDDDITTNLSLQAKLAAEYQVKLPEVPDAEELSPTAYFAAVTEAIAGQPRWEVLPDEMLLWFFSFSKFLMYRDLDPVNWGDEQPLDNHAQIMALVGRGFAPQQPLCGEEDGVDALVPVRDAMHVVDADSSQTIVIEEVKRGANLVIQGPPGTGKSQTITNLIAAAVHAGKTVLFVAEKMAALEVVKRRLDNIGLGPLCLELHSNKTHKAAVHQELAATLALTKPKPADVERLATELQATRDQLNAAVAALHRPMSESGRSPFQLIGELVRLRATGVPPAGYQFDNALSWTTPQVQQISNQLRDLATHLETIGDPRHHPWRGVMLPAILPMDVDRLAARVPTAIEKLEALTASATKLAIALKSDAPVTLAEAGALCRLGERILKLPPLDRSALTDAVWHNAREAISQLVADVRRYRECRVKLDGMIVESAWATDVTKARVDLAAHGGSWFRWFSGDYRAALATLRGLLKGPVPKPLAARLAILDTLTLGRELQWKLDVNQQCVDLGRRAFGSLWRGAESDAEALAAIDAWDAQCRRENLPEDYRQLAAGTADPAAMAPLIKDLAEKIRSTIAELEALGQLLQLDFATAFGVALDQVAITEISARLRSWTEHREALSQWIAYRLRWTKLADDGLEPLAAAIDRGDVPPERVVDTFMLVYCEQLLREALRERPHLAAFDGQSHEKLIAHFRDLDSKRIEVARQQVQLDHHVRLPRELTGGELGLLQREINKKRRHLPLRQLLKQAGRAVQQIKPVFMMSPISVAQYLEPGAVDFDILLVDEASQIRPVDAFGAIARTKQIVIVGDDRQLPPTRFFDKVLDDPDAPEPEDDGVVTGDLESILGLCVAQGLPQRMLRWHYRSRHQSLIAVSNREFYGNRLYVVPSPHVDSPELGLRFHHLPGALFDRGGTATNRDEAQAVARAVIDHARRTPDLSLGVGAFSVAQRDAILEELELLRRSEPGLETFFAADRPDPFFVKNLENIQGDERDVILISVGYGRDKEGKLTMNFGPLTSDGGERRLNVLISRARRRCEVFSSITADDIDLHRTRSLGARALKTFLAFAQTGLLETPAAPSTQADETFEEQVAAALESCGHHVEHLDGAAEFFVDLAVQDPEHSGRYLLGISCDGSSYRAARSARDRDRLREQVLRDRGWQVHRIWCADWFKRPEEQLRRAVAAIEAAKIAASRQ